jgi:hypothetical protein
MEEGKMSFEQRVDQASLPRPLAQWPRTFLSKAEYCALLVSNRSLTRWDLPSANVRGLRDSVSGEWFVIEEEELFA